MTNYFLFLIFTFAMIFYCIFFHNKSLYFLLSVIWFAFNIITISIKIYYDFTLIYADNPITYDFIFNFSILLGRLKNINFILFIIVMLSYLFGKNKDYNRTRDSSDKTGDG